MEWVLPFILLLGVLIVGVPVGVYFGAVALLWASSLVPGGTAARSRTRFLCPVRKQPVTADFMTEAGSDHPSNVLSCSAFSDPARVLCEKACLGFAGTHSISTVMLPRFSLIAGGTAYRAPAASSGTAARHDLN